MTRALIKPLLIVAVVLVLPLILLVASGESFTGLLDRWRADPPSDATLATLVVVVLASDVVLPVPSGPVATLAGAQLGTSLGAAAACAGMTAGAAIAFALARRWGRPLAERLSSPESLAELDDACQRHGPWMLAVTRPLPVLAEAGALLVGALQMPWRRFLPPVLLANAALGVAYAALGEYAAEREWLPMAVGLAAAAPLAAFAYRPRRKA
ncbi:MAG: VTT domain-containing protein [Planctomycetales bacterium]|nr:VTT domain-containing protein [Planctomycetales bacterium]